jgi:hypothetical protein
VLKLTATVEASLVIAAISAAATSSPAVRATRS